MKKRVLSLLLALLLLCGLLPVTAFAAQEITGYKGEYFEKALYGSIYTEIYGTMDTSVPGLTLYQEGNYTLTLKGTPTTAGTYSFALHIYEKSTGQEIDKVNYYMTIKADHNWYCEYIYISSEPKKIDYAVGETFDPKGMVVTAVLSDGDGNTKTADVTNEVYYYDFQTPVFMTVGSDRKLRVYVSLPDKDGSIGEFSDILLVNVTDKGEPVINDKKIPNARVGVKYDITLQQSGSKGEWNIYYNPGHKNEFEGTGLQFNSSGRMWGTPTKAGTYTFTVMLGNEVYSTFQEYTLVIEEEATEPETIGYGLWVGGIEVTSENSSNILGNGSAAYEPELHTLYLKDANISFTGVLGCEEYGIFCDSGDLTIQISDSCLMNINGSSILNAAIWVTDGGLTLTGNGSLKIICGSTINDYADPDGRGIRARDNITINGPAVTIQKRAKDKTIFIGVETEYGNLIYTKGSLEVSCGSGYSALYLGGKLLNNGGAYLYEGEDTAEQQVAMLTGGTDGGPGAHYVLVTDRYIAIAAPDPDPAAPTPDPVPDPDPDPEPDPAPVTDPNGDDDGDTSGTKKPKKHNKDDDEDDEDETPAKSEPGIWMWVFIGTAALLAAAVIVIVVLLVNRNKGSGGKNN